MRFRRALIGLLVLPVAVASVGTASPAVTVMVGGETLVTSMSVVDAEENEVGSLLFVLHEAGRTISTAGVSSGAWYEAVLWIDSAVQTFRGRLAASAVSLAVGSGGSVRIPLGVLGEAHLDVRDRGPDFLPFGCQSMSVSQSSGGGGSPIGRMWSWQATTQTVGARSADVSGSLADYRLTSRPPRFPDVSFATLSSRGLARVYETPVMPAGPVTFTGGVSCLV